MAEPTHWTRPLKSGGVEFYFRAPDGQTMKGSAGDRPFYRVLRDKFEEWSGCTLLEPVERPMRGKSS